MNRYVARLEKGSDVLIDELETYIGETTEASGRKSWRGHFEVGFEMHLEPGGSYRLSLDDGRSGEILIKKFNITSGNEGQSVTFLGNGPLD